MIITVTKPVTVTVEDTDAQTKEGLKVYVFDGATYTGFSGTTDASGEAAFILPQGSYRFRADSGGTQFWSGETDHCTVPGCLDAMVVVTVPVTVTVEDTNGEPKEGVPVYAFDGATYTGFNGTTNIDGEVAFTLPEGSYRFRADFNGTQFWSGEANHCAVPGCSSATVVVTLPVTVTVEDTNGVAKEGVPVYVFDGTTYTNFNGTTGVDGEVVFTLPMGDYRFRAGYNGTQFWSGEVNHCTIPGCESGSITVTIPVTVLVEDTNGTPKEGLSVYVFDGTTYIGYNGTTDIDGEVAFTLPMGDYRFRADADGNQFWSGETNHCTVPGCLSATVTITLTNVVTVTVEDTDNQPKEGLPVYVFDGDTYLSLNGTSDEFGQVEFNLLPGNYRFRADFNGTHFWSGETNHCTVPGCTAATVTVTIPVTVTIDYTYDPLYRLTEADYSTGEYFWYTYDAVGNRLTQETHEGTNTYAYDIANRLIEVDGVAYTWDANGNLLSDGVSTYTYDHANRLTSVVQGTDTYTFTYNGLGDRLQQTVNGAPTDYSLDLVSSLTQVLVDGTNAFLYGLGRVGEEQSSGWAYHMTDALRSVRQVLDSKTAVGMSRSYEPFGSTVTTSGAAITNYGFTGEWVDSTRLIHLRSRYYMPQMGRFLTTDILPVISIEPRTVHRYLYVSNNPINLVDPSGRCWSNPESTQIEREVCLDAWEERYGPLSTQEAIYWSTLSYYEFKKEWNARIKWSQVTPMLSTVAIGAQIDTPALPFADIVVGGCGIGYLLYLWITAPPKFDFSAVERRVQLSLAAASGDGGASEAAQHLAMLVGGDVGGFSHHPGKPDPEGRDHKKNAEGLRNTLRSIRRNMRSGETLEKFLTRQGWDNRQILDLIDTLENYVENTLQIHVEYFNVSESVAAEIRELVAVLGIP